MTNTKLRNIVAELNKVTKQEFVINSWETGGADSTQYGLMRQNTTKKSKTLDIVLECAFNKRAIYYHIQGYLNIHALLNTE